jgi:hypothetical protein
MDFQPRKRTLPIENRVIRPGVATTKIIAGLIERYFGDRAEVIV